MTYSVNQLIGQPIFSKNRKNPVGEAMGIAYDPSSFQIKALVLDSGSSYPNFGVNWTDVKIEKNAKIIIKHPKNIQLLPQFLTGFSVQTFTSADNFKTVIDKQKSNYGFLFDLIFKADKIIDLEIFLGKTTNDKYRISTKHVFSSTSQQIILNNNFWLKPQTGSTKPVKQQKIPSFTLFLPFYHSSAKNNF